MTMKNNDISRLAASICQDVDGRIRSEEMTKGERIALLLYLSALMRGEAEASLALEHMRLSETPYEEACHEAIKDQ
jgi:hypothetical protein